MRKETRRSRLLFRRFLALGIRALFSVRRTLRYGDGFSAPGPCVIAVFHDRMLPLLACMAGSGAVALTSRNHLGSAVASVLRSWGYEIVSGSSRRSGKEAMRALEQKLAEGKVVIITPDGPRGPRHTFKPGAVVLAIRAKVPLYVVCPHYRGIELKPAWDRFRVPLPFAVVEFSSEKHELHAASSAHDLSDEIAHAEQRLRALCGDTDGLQA